MKNMSFAALSLSSLLALSACSSAEPAGIQPAESGGVEQEQTLSVVVSTTVLGSVVRDIVRCALGDDSSVTVVMPIGADPHDFQPSSAQVATMASADLVVVNGLGLEVGLLAAVEAIEGDGAAVLEIAPQVDPILFGEGIEDDHDDHADEESPDGGAEDGYEEDGHGGGFDPHFWLDMERMALATLLIGTELQSVSDGNFQECAEETAAAIRTAEVTLRTSLETVPEDRRVLVTDHDALAYFAESFGYTVVGVVIPGGSTLGEPNSRELAALVDVIRDRDVPAIFGDATLSEAILTTLANEADRDVQVVSLFIGSLGGPGSGATNYIEMMTTNATRITEARTQ